MNASSSAVEVGLGLGESMLRKELGDLRPRDHSFGFLESKVSSQPDLRSRGLGRGVLMISDVGREIISEVGLTPLFLDE
jgi:hypothetical protein